MGPDPSRALAMVVSQGKTLESGRCEASACVRFYHWELCPVSAAADRVMCELSGPRLHLDTLANSYIMRAPASLGDKPIASSWFTTQVGQVLRDAGELWLVSTPLHACKAWTKHGLLAGVLSNSARKAAPARTRSFITASSTASTMLHLSGRTVTTSRT